METSLRNTPAPRRSVAALRRGHRTLLSLVAPAFNEEGNLRPLYEQVRTALDGFCSWELVLVDDGSTDASAEVMDALAALDPRVRPVRLGKNYGQTAALLAGCRHARAPLIATLDADLQSDPGDLPMMMAALEDADAVVGYRLNRRDDWLRRVSSKVANAIRNRLTGDWVRDTGCPLKLFRAEAIRSVPPFEGMHRFLPTLLRWHSRRVVEVAVSHRPRTRGESKYGVRNRAFVALADLLAVRWMRRRQIRLPERVMRTADEHLDSLATERTA